ncbi:MAG: YidC/Oxa1 family membrane protein insertase [Lachnospiraceae bacterium]|nr:YidC/Oxa1 family membrane protein insertase [Lachnospiraceae bacterium]
MLFHLLYRMIISPIEFLLEFCFIALRRNFTLKTTLVGMSITVSLLCLPLYLRADAVQHAEHEKQKSMEKWLKHLRKTFSGDERLLMMNAYYREQDYKPASALKGTLSLLLQIPFFLAAYHYISGIGELEGSSALGIADLSRPDALLSIGGITINVLPVLMTAINCISGAIYTKGHAVREKLQVYILAAFFLVFLYQSPAALVLYWTMNNIFSLMKNVVTKYSEDPKRILHLFISLLGLAFAAHGIYKGKYRRFVLLGEYGWCAFGIILPILCQLPLLMGLWRKLRRHTPKQGPVVSAKSVTLTALTATLFLGALIPLSVISSSSQDFVDIYHFVNPLHYVLSSICIAGGVFLLWGGVIGMLVPEKSRWILYCLFLTMLLGGMADYFFWGHDFGTLSSVLTFHERPVYGLQAKLVNLAVLAVLTLLVFLLGARYERISNSICAVLLLAIVAMSLRDLYVTNRDLTAMKSQVSEEQEAEMPKLTFDKNGKNVVVIMLDRAISGFVPYLFTEKPELYEMYDGFTYYPNTVSFGKVTVYGAPALYGGYEYTPDAINARSDEPLVKKHNEALKVLPAIFSQAGYHTSVADSPFANFSTIPDMSIYDDLPGVNAYNMEGRFTQDNEQVLDTAALERSFFFYSIFKTAPVLTQTFIYDGGDYLSLKSSVGANISFMNTYSVLTALPQMTVTVEDGRGSLFLLDNNVTHEPMSLELPDYVPSTKPEGPDEDLGIRYSWDGQELNTECSESMSHYHVNMAALLRLGEWFDMLRELGVYDNTRIILVGDHGGLEGNFGFPKVEFLHDVEKVNPLLLVKDFGAEGFTVSDEFMTHADVPYLATKELFTPAVNPYTGKELGMDGKQDILITFAMDGTSNIRNLAGKNVYDCIDSDWYTVKDNIFDLDNWEHVRYSK